MIFRTIPTLEERYSHLESRIHEVGSRYFDCSEPGMARSRAHEEWLHRHTLERLQQDDLLPLVDAAAALGISAQDYRVLAEKKQAILIMAENGAIERVPAWALVEKASGTMAVNDLAVVIAGHYADQHAGQPATGFCVFMDKEHVTLNMQQMDETLPKMGAVRTAFLGLSQWARKPEQMGLSLVLSDAVTLAKGGVEDAIYAQILQQAQTRLGVTVTVSAPARASALRIA